MKAEEDTDLFLSFVFFEWHRMVSGRTCGQSPLIISPTFFTWVSFFAQKKRGGKEHKLHGQSSTGNRFTILMRISTSVSCRSLKYLFYFSIFESFRKGPSASQPTLSSQWICVTWLPLCSSPSSSAIQLMQHGSDGMANTRRNVKISTRKDGRLPPSTWFSTLWLWFYLFTNWASCRCRGARKCNWCFCLVLDSCEFLPIQLEKIVIILADSTKQPAWHLSVYYDYTLWSSFPIRPTWPVSLILRLMSFSLIADW